ncbi:nucleolar protein dao-5-like isoform X2 [Drosophila bipectinata]|uniref:nucleolar protein dao-5-like isoform X2 n=1 Tax=Drosophila bipectinata TaxID=42026 RepID=UPI0038B36514
MSENLKEQPSGSNIRGLIFVQGQSSDDEKMMPNSNENSEPRAGTSRSFETLAGHGEVSAGGGFEAISPPESQPPPLESPPPQQEQERTHNSNSMNRLMQPEGGNYHQRLALMPTLRSIFLPGLDLATPTTELFHYFVRYGELKRVTVLSNTDETSFAIVTSMRNALAANPRHLGGRMHDLDGSRSWLNRRNSQNTWNDRPMFRQGRVTRHFYNRHQAGNAVGWMRMIGSAAITLAGNAAAGALVPYAGSGMPMMGNARSGRVLHLAVMRSSPLATGGSTGAVTGVRRWRTATSTPLPIGDNPARSIAPIMSNAADAISPMGGNAADAAALTCNSDVVPVPPSGNTTCAEPDTPSTSTGVVSSRDINIIHTRSMTRMKAAASQLPVRRSERLHKMLSAKPPSKAAPARAPKRSRPTASKRPAKRARVAKKPEAKKPEAKKPVAKKRRQRKPSKKKDAVSKPKRKAVARKQVRKESNKNIPVERLPQWTVKPGRSVLPAAVEKEVCDVGSGGTARNLTAPRTVRQGLRQAAENNQFCPPESTKIVKKTRASSKKTRVVEKKKAASNGRNKKTRALKEKIVKKQEAVRRRTRSKSKARKRPVKGPKAAQVESHEKLGTTPPPPADIGGSSQAGKSGYRASSSQIVTRAKSGTNPGPQSTIESVGFQAAPQVIANTAGASGSTPALSNSGETSIPILTMKNVASQAAPQTISSKPEASNPCQNNPPPPPTPQRASRKPPQPAEPKRDFKLNSYTNVEANRKTSKYSPSEEDENGERPKKKDFMKKEKKD